MDAALFSFQRVWTLVSGVLAALSALPGLARGSLAGAVWGRAFAELRLAEAAARRAIFAMAAAHDFTPPPPPTALPPADDDPAPRAGRAPGRASAPFSLSDPIRLPRLPNPSVEPALLAPPDGGDAIAHPTAGLQARMDALAAVLADPGLALERYLRLRARPRRHIFSRPAAPRLRPGNPPGFIRARWLDWEMDVLMEIHALAGKAQAASPLVPSPA
ncbi:MAG: hypothetical protein AAFQ22_04100 [Pseudomonadota bacterium]